MLDASGKSASRHLSRFIQEYSILSEIDHPGVVRIYDQGFTDDHAYIAMEYFPGGDLRTELSAGMAQARVLQVRELAAGASVGYGASETRDRPARLAILGVGYADGYHRAASSRDGRPGARVFVRGGFAPLIGRVSMDLMTVDVTGIAGVARDDWAELFGPHVPVDEVAAHAGTVGYELLTGLGHRAAWRYVG